ncbi:TolC family protein [Campylobacter sp. LR196d]|nr:TolC family protein [Campylobacter sp. LR196d]
MPIIDSGSAWANKALQRASNAVSKASVQNELYKVQESVINAFFSSLLFDEQLKQNEIYINDLQKDYENMLSRYKNGVALKDNVDKISIELLNAKQDKQNLQSQKDIANDTLSRLIGLKDFNLEIPSFENCKEELFKFEFDFENSRGNIFSKRPELDYFYLRKEEAQTQKKLELSKSLPYVDAFVQGGYGNPGLNMLKNGTDSFYIVGLRFTWDFSNLYSKYQQDELIRKEQLQIGSLEDEFYLNAKISLNSNIKTAKSLIFQLSQDDEIIALQEKIVLNSKAKFLNGVLSINDFLSDVNQFYIAKLQRSYRQIQFLSIIYQIKQLVNEWNLRN